MDTLTLLRQFRIGPFAIFDTVLSYVGVVLLSPLLSKLFTLLHVSIPKTSWLWWTLPLAVVFHLLFSQDTPLMEILSQPLGFVGVGAILVFMIYMGVKDCSWIE